MRLCEFLVNWCNADCHIHWGLVGDDQFQPCPAAVASDNVVVLFVYVGEQVEVLRLSVEVYVAGWTLGGDAVADAVGRFDDFLTHHHTSLQPWRMLFRF